MIHICLIIQFLIYLNEDVNLTRDNFLHTNNFEFPLFKMRQMLFDCLRVYLCLSCCYCYYYLFFKFNDLNELKAKKKKISLTIKQKTITSHTNTN